MTNRRLLSIAVLTAFALSVFVSAGSAQAAVIHKPAGTFELTPWSGYAPPTEIAIDEQAGYVYVQGRYNQKVEKFDLEGNPVPFSGILGPNEHQGVHFEGAWFGGDAFKLTCPQNSESTGEIEWNEEHFQLEANIKAALEAKCGGTLKVTGFDAQNTDIEFSGTLGHQDLPEQISCTKVSGSGTCFTTGGEDGSATTNKLNLGCGSCYQLVVDNSSGPNQGVIYVAAGDNLNACCPDNQTVPNPPGGIEAYLPSGLPTHSTYKGNPIARLPWEQGYGEPVGLGLGGLYTRSQEEFDIRACGVAVDPDGNLVIAHGGFNQEFSYFDNLGILPWATNDQQEGTLLGTINSDASNPCRVEFDSAGNLLYETSSDGFEMPFTEGAIREYAAPEFHASSGVGTIPAELRDPSKLFHEGPDRSFSLDSEDHVYALRPSGPPRVQQFDRSGSLTETFGAEELMEPADVAIDKATGTVYVSDSSFETTAEDIHVFKAFTVPNSITQPFSATGQTSGDLRGEVDLAEAGEEVTDCEFEYTTEALFIAKEFEEATKIPCDEGTTFTANESVSTEVSGLALEETYFFRLVTENVNGRSNGNVRKFLPHAVVDLTTKPASNVAPRSATLNGSFNGNGDGTEFFFEYGHGLPGVYTATTPTQSAGTPSGLTQVSLPIEGLELETTYHFRVVATNGTGTSRGFDESFRTPPAVAGLKTEPATEIGQQTVTLNGQFTGDGHDTEYFFEYGPTESYGQVSSTVDAGTTSGPTPISAPITTYFGYSTYHYRVVAENQFGKTVGKDRTFSTKPAPLPGIEETSIEDVTPTSAHVSAMVAPNRWDASWLFEWGETTGYGTFTESEPILPGETTEYLPIEADITGLKPETIYHFRAVAFNFTGVTNGPDLVFRTPAAPKIDSANATAVGQTTAHLSSRVVANLSATNVHFEYGASAGYGAQSAAFPIGSDTLARESAVDLTGLTPGTTYHYRVVGSNRWGTTAGADRTFTTLPGPPAATPPAPKTKCPKGKVKRHGKCVPKHKHKRHKKKKKKSRRHGRSR